MSSPSIVAVMIGELIDRGVKRNDLAKLLGVRPPTISMLKSGKGSLNDSKLGSLARLHGECSERDVLAIKYLEWLEESKGISVEELERAIALRRSQNRDAHKIVA